VSGKSIRGILNYNENKVRDGEAVLLMAAGFPREPDELSFRNKLERFELLTRQNERTRTNALHISLNFSPRDQVDSDRLQQIATEYMAKIGFGGQPFLVYQHFDAAHPHIHIATTNIAEGGIHLETHNIGRIQSEKARKAIEEAYGLIRAEDKKKEATYPLKPANLQKALYGKAETKAAISAIVRSVVASYKFTSLPELNAVLRQFNVIADRGTEGSLMFEKKGMVYRLLDENGKKVGVPIKASAIYDRPTLANLKKKFPLNKSARVPYGERMKHLLDKALASPTEKAFTEALEKQQIRILFRENSQGNIYGVTFIDNATCAAFNGSSLGKQYGAKAFLARMPGQMAIVTPLTSTGEPRESEIETAAQLSELYQRPGIAAVIAKILDDTLASVEESDVPAPYRRKKKKNQLSLS